jgi:hypothetical protein
MANVRRRATSSRRDAFINARQSKLVRTSEFTLFFPVSFAAGSCSKFRPNKKKLQSADFKPSILLKVGAKAIDAGKTAVDDLPWAVQGWNTGDNFGVAGFFRVQ